MDMTKLANRLREYREESNLTQKMLAEKAEVAQTYIATIETAKVDDTDILHLDRLASALGITLDDLLCDYINVYSESNPSRRKTELLNRLNMSDTEALKKFSEQLELYIRSINK